MEGLINVNQRITQTMEKKNSPKLKTITEEGSIQSQNQPKTHTIPAPQIKAPSHRPQAQTNPDTHEVTGNSFFNDVTLNMNKKEPLRQPGLVSHKTNMIKKQVPQQMTKVSEQHSEAKPNQGFNIYQMEQAKPNPEVQRPMTNVEPANPNESILATKIKREKVNNDLNCTVNDESILEYFVDDNGYLVTEKGQLMYDDNGNVVKLTDEQIKEFKDNEMYEEVEK